MNKYVKIFPIIVFLIKYCISELKEKGIQRRMLKLLKNEDKQKSGGKNLRNSHRRNIFNRKIFIGGGNENKCQTPEQKDESDGITKNHKSNKKVTCKSSTNYCSNNRKNNYSNYTWPKKWNWKWTWEWQASSLLDGIQLLNNKKKRFTNKRNANQQTGKQRNQITSEDLKELLAKLIITQSEDDSIDKINESKTEKNLFNKTENILNDDDNLTSKNKTTTHSKRNAEIPVKIKYQFTNEEIKKILPDVLNAMILNENDVNSKLKITTESEVLLNNNNNLTIDNYLKINKLTQKNKSILQEGYDEEETESNLNIKKEQSWDWEWVWNW